MTPVRPQTYLSSSPQVAPIDKHQIKNDAGEAICEKAAADLVLHKNFSFAHPLRQHVKGDE